MKVKQLNETFETDEFYYDLFEGGYIKPEKYLESSEDIEKVKTAIKTIEEFKNTLLTNNLMKMI